MVAALLPLFICILTAVQAQPALLNATQVVGVTDSGETFSDWSILHPFEEAQVMRLEQIMLCGGTRNPLIGMQATAYLMDEQNIKTSKQLTQIGTINSNCTKLDLQPGEFVAQMSLRYDTQIVRQVSFQTNTGAQYS